MNILVDFSRTPHPNWSLPMNSIDSVVTFGKVIKVAKTTKSLLVNASWVLAPRL